MRSRNELSSLAEVSLYIVRHLLFPTHSRNKTTQVACKSFSPLCASTVVIVIGTRRIKTYLTLKSLESKLGTYTDVNKPTATPNVKFNDLNRRIQRRVAECAWNMNEWQQFSCYAKL